MFFFVVFFFRNAWYEDGRLLLILVTLCVVLPLAMLPKIGKDGAAYDLLIFIFHRLEMFCFFSPSLFWPFTGGRLPGLHQQSGLPLHPLLRCCGEWK